MPKTSQGTIIALSTNFVTVKINDVFVKAQIRGNVKKQESLLVGDQVIIEHIDSDVVITSVLSRKNELYRPRIANIDQALVISSLTSPAINFIILDKLLTIFNYYGIKAVLVFTKKDILDSTTPEIISQTNNYQNVGYDCFLISNKTKEGINELAKTFSGKTSVLTGISGVGKSSLLNSLEPNLHLVTNEVSSILKQGRHTTTATKLYFLTDGIIADSPGFQVLKVIGLTKVDFANNYPGLKRYITHCKFRNCLHLQEPDCSVKNHLDEEITKFFYQNYCKILAEWNNQDA